MSNNIGKYPLGYTNTIVFELQKEHANEVFEVDNYEVTIGDKTWQISSNDVTTTTVGGIETIFIPWVYLATDFTVKGQYAGCLHNTTKEINKYLDFKFFINFEDNC